MRRPIKILLTLFGVALLVYLVCKTGPSRILQAITTLGWGLMLPVAVGGVSHAVRTWAWWLTLVRERCKPPFLRLFALRLVGEAVQLSVAGPVFGDTTRAMLMSPSVPIASGISSVALDRGMYVVTGALVSVVGISCTLISVRLPELLRAYAVLLAFGLLAFVSLAAMAFRKHWPVLSTAVRFLERGDGLKRVVEKRRSAVQSIETTVFSFHREEPRAFWGSLALNLTSHALAVLEVFLILWLMGLKTTLFNAFLMEAMTKVVNIVGALIPGNIGTYEGGNILILGMFGFSGAAGLALAVTRRLRGLFWTAVGIAFLIGLTQSRRIVATSRRARRAAVVPQAPEESEGSQESKGERDQASVVVVIAACGGRQREFVVPLARVAGLPVALRAILGARRAGASRFIVVVDSAAGPRVRRVLETSKRLPETVEWLALPQDWEGETSLPAILRQMATLSGSGLVLLLGDRTYHPSLHERVNKWEKQDGILTLTTTTGQPVGIAFLPHQAVISIAQHAPGEIQTVEELHAWLKRTHTVRCEPVPDDLWQRIAGPEDLLRAERKLDRWLYKTTDGIFARLNRKVSIPISRQLSRAPISPNMVTLFALGVSLASGAFFAFGGYLHTVIGAVLSHWASILDGCDGEVARLTLQESQFGCWLETVCDYLYYLFVFTGMTIGLWRTSGALMYPALGVLLLFGAIMSIITTGYQRRRLTGNRSEKYLALWQEQAGRQRHDLFLWFGRRVEFMIRRSFLPYAFLFFAICNLIPVAFFLSAFGANLVWPITLRSIHFFAGGQKAKLAIPPVS